MNNKQQRVYDAAVKYATGSVSGRDFGELWSAVVAAEKKVWTWSRAEGKVYVIYDPSGGIWYETDCECVAIILCREFNKTEYDGNLDYDDATTDEFRRDG